MLAYNVSDRGLEVAIAHYAAVARNCVPRIGLHHQFEREMPLVSKFMRSDGRKFWSMAKSVIEIMSRSFAVSSGSKSFTRDGLLYMHILRLSATKVLFEEIGETHPKRTRNNINSSGAYTFS